jgi:hypothetical protein
MKKMKSFFAGTMVAGSLLQGTFSDAQTAASVKLESKDAILPFHVNVPQSDLDELRHLVSTARFPDKETVNDQSQGVQLATMQKTGKVLGHGIQLA